MLGYNANATAVAGTGATALPSPPGVISSPTDEDHDTKSTEAREWPHNAAQDSGVRDGNPNAAPSVGAHPALKLQLHLKRPFHLGLKSLANAERDEMEHDLVSELCAALNIDPKHLELLEVSHPSTGPVTSGKIAPSHVPSLLTNADSHSVAPDTPLSDFDLSTLKSFACMFHCDDAGHLKVREMVARFRANVSLAPLLRRPLQLGAAPKTAQSLNERFDSMYIVPGTVSTFEEMIAFFGADEETYFRFTAAHPVKLTTVFLKDFEITYAQQAFRGMDVAGATLLQRRVLSQAATRLSADLVDRLHAFKDSYINQVEFIQFMDSVHGEFMSAWSFKTLLEQIERAYIQLLTNE